MKDLSFNTLVAALMTASILISLEVAALLQGNHDALVALISVLTGSALGAGATVAIINRPKMAPPDPAN